jgi:CDP-4-dehydro-6-deoxyglucose reductase
MALSPEDEARGLAIACQARARSALKIQVEQIAQPRIEPKRHSAIIKGMVQLAPDVTHLTLEISGADALDYRPGQYANIVLSDGNARCFSMASKPRNRTIDFHIRRITGGHFTESMLSQLSPGDALEVELPQGTFFLHEADDRPLLMVATGTGLAPIRSILESLLDSYDCPPVTLYWGARTAADLYLHNEIGAWGDRLCNFNYVPVLSQPDAAWRGRHGYVQHAILKDFADLSDFSIYMCGLPDMIRDARTAFQQRAASLEHMYADIFHFQHALKQSSSVDECVAFNPAASLQSLEC